MTTPNRKEVFAVIKTIFFNTDDNTLLNTWMSDKQIASIIHQRMDESVLPYGVLNRSITGGRTFENDRIVFQEVTLFYYRHRFTKGCRVRNRPQVKFYYINKCGAIEPKVHSKAQDWKRIFATPLHTLSPSATKPSASSKRPKRKLTGVHNLNSNTKFKLNTSQYELKLAELRYAWKNTYGIDVPFPAEHIHFADRSKAKLPPAQHESVFQRQPNQN